MTVYVKGGEVGMTNKEAIETIKHAISEIEWMYPMNYAAAFDKAVEALEKQEPGWISVKDRLPEYDKDVLIYAVGKTTNEPKIAISYLMDKFYFGSRPINLEEPIWHEPWQYFRVNNTITHWMPLPEPPKEET